MARYGPVVTDVSTAIVGLAQIRVGDSASNIANPAAALSVSDSLGALANTIYRGNADYFKLESGFPLIEDWTTPIREGAALECAFKQITPANMALAHGYDPLSAPYSGYGVHSGEIKLGARTDPDFVRMESVYTYPNQTDTMTIIFPRAQVTSPVEMDHPAEEAAAIAITFEAKNASSDVDGGDPIWDDRPLGRIVWA